MSYQSTYFELQELYELEDRFSEVTEITYSASYFYSDSTTFLSTSFNGVGTDSSTITDSTNITSSISFYYKSVEEEDGDFLSNGRTEVGSFSYQDGTTSTLSFSDINDTIISDYWPIKFTTFIDPLGKTTFSYSGNFETLSYKDSFVSSSSYSFFNSVSDEGSLSERVVSLSSFLQTFFQEGGFTEKRFFTNVVSTKAAFYSASLSSSNNLEISQETSFESVFPHKIQLYKSSYVCRSDSPVQFWFIDEAPPLGKGTEQTHFDLIHFIASSATSFSSISFFYENVFEPASTTYSDQTHSKRIGVDSEIFSYSFTSQSSTSTSIKRRNNSLSSSLSPFTTIMSSTVSRNGTFSYNWTTNQNGSYYDYLSYITIFDGFYDNIYLINGLTTNLQNISKSYYKEIAVVGVLGIKEASLQDSTYSISTSYTLGNLSSSSIAQGATVYDGPAAKTSRLYRENFLSSASFSSPKIFDIKFNGGFCAFLSSNSSIYKNLLIDKLSGEGDVFITDDWASICPNIRSSLANHNFTSFVKDCWTFSTTSFSETIIKARDIGFIDSTFKLTSGGTFTTNTDGRLINSGGKETTIEISTNDTVASYFSYSFVEGSCLTQIMRFRLTDSMEEGEKTSWTTFNTTNSYRDFNTGGKLILYPGGGYFLTIKSNETLLTKSFTLHPTASPETLEFKKGEGFAITTAKLFAKAPSFRFTTMPYVYYEDSD